MFTSKLTMNKKTLLNDTGVKISLFTKKVKGNKSGKILHLVCPFQEILGKGILMEEVTTN
ncbi:hypothetical protein BG911_00105 [Bacillus altitudinis]|nr:hypothetical protein [Bacillus altitudinis]OPX02978.1 hypothetical protein BG911_00105 [Bacillus altitudinis]QKL22979.1 hypothetical protein RI02_15255 [Bacillus altitudinis]QKL26712.1 hypothetical protein EQK04_15255 [Bacillus altitudinis]TFW49037.1 hypothetical protein ES896_01090 [Bacillus sp. 005/A4HT-01/001]